MVLKIGYGLPKGEVVFLLEYQTKCDAGRMQIMPSSFVGLDDSFDYIA